MDQPLGDLLLVSIQQPTVLTAQPTAVPQPTVTPAAPMPEPPQVVPTTPVDGDVRGISGKAMTEAATGSGLLQFQQRMPPAPMPAATGTAGGTGK